VQLRLIEPGVVEGSGPGAVLGDSRIGTTTYTAELPMVNLPLTTRLHRATI